MIDLETKLRCLNFIENILNKDLKYKGNDPKKLKKALETIPEIKNDLTYQKKKIEDSELKFEAISMCWESMQKELPFCNEKQKAVVERCCEILDLIRIDIMTGIK